MSALEWADGFCGMAAFCWALGCGCGGTRVWLRGLRGLRGGDGGEVVEGLESLRFVVEMGSGKVGGRLKRVCIAGVEGCWVDLIFLCSVGCILLRYRVEFGI